MNIPMHSLDKEQIAQFATEGDATAAALIAAEQDTTHKFTVSYSPRALRFLVSVRDEHGNMLGYLHPILE
jgi:hypothetical protein